MADSGGSDECALGHNAGSLLSRDTGDRGALSPLAKLNQKLNYAPTEARRVCVNMMTSVVVSIGGMQDLGKFGIFEGGREARSVSYYHVIIGACGLVAMDRKRLSQCPALK